MMNNWKVLLVAAVIFFLFLGRRNDKKWGSQVGKNKKLQDKPIKEDYLVTSRYPYPGYAWFPYYHPRHCGIDGKCKHTPNNHGYITDIPDAPYHPYYGRPLYVPWNLTTRLRYRRPWYLL